jgi:hypothetical protein
MSDGSLILRDCSLYFQSHFAESQSGAHSGLCAGRQTGWNSTQADLNFGVSTIYSPPGGVLWQEEWQDAEIGM